MSRRNLTVSLSESDSELFAEAMELDGLEQLGTWMKQVCKLHARRIIDGTQDKEILDAIKSVELRVEIAESNLASDIADIDNKLEELKP